MGPRQRIDLLIPVAMAVSLVLPGWASLGLFALLAAVALWVARSAGGSRLWLLPAVAVLLVLVLELTGPPGDADPAAFRQQVEESYRQIWTDLDEAAERTGDRLRSLDTELGRRLEVFRALEAAASEGSPAVTTVVLLDHRGTVSAWGGTGLLHAVEDLGPLAGGRFSLASFSAVTLVAVEELQTDRGTWHVAAGTSLRTDGFPFAETVIQPSWTVVEPGTPAAGDSMRVDVGSGPVLVVETTAGAVGTASSFEPRGWRRWAWLIWGGALLLMGWTSMTGTATVWPALTLGAATVALGLAAGAAPGWLALAALGAVVGSFNARVWLLGRSLGSAVVLGVLAAVSVPALGHAWLAASQVAELSGGSTFEPQALFARVALMLWVWSLLSGVFQNREGSTEESSKPAFLALAAVLLAATTLDRTLVCLGFLAIAGGSIGVWLRQRPIDGLGNRLLVVAAAASVLAASGWELLYRAAEKERVEEVLLPAMAPPTPAEIDALADEMEASLTSWDVTALVPAGFDQHSRQDLAFEIWRRSPLARYGGLSALRVLPRSGGLSSFSFGLPLNRERWVEWTSPLLGTVPVPAWQDAALVGDGVLESADVPWAYAEYALALQPGFRLRSRYQGDLAEVLLRSAPTAAAASRDLGEVRYGLFDSDGLPVLSPWIRIPELSETILRGGVGPVDTAEGPSIAYSAVGSDGVRVLFLRQMSLPRALERIGSHALPSLLLVAFLGLALQLPGWIRQGLRSTWMHVWRSYSRRLVLVYSVLLLVPLGIINFLVVRAFEERLVRDQEIAALRAVESVQGVLGEYVKALEPGFGIDAALDDELLHWLASVVHHDVNLYWRGSVYASSKAELFTAGLLPRRIPGEIYSGLTLLGHEVSMRTNQTERSEYLELYAPVTVPGVSFEQTRLIVSLPMLAQQEETRAQIASLRRRSLLGAAAVVLVVMALGARLARRFTKPLTEIVEGTQRIASGEASLDLQPAELELATLVEAIDDMAGRIHSGRQELLREKSVVDRMVDNITAGVVSLDEQGRVMMANRVAGEMIGLAVGQRLDSVAAETERLQPLAAFVDEEAGQVLKQRTLILEDTEGEEREWTVVWVPLPGEGEPSSLLVVEDVTEVLRGQRLQAWAEMARMIAHEIKNPLTPIRLSTEHMQEVYTDDPQGFAPVFESCTDNILAQVGELQEIASEFSTYSRIPKIEPRPGDLVETVDEIVDAYRTSSSNGVRVEVVSPEAPVEAVFDAKLIGRAVRNLIENAVRVAPRGSRVEVAIERQGDRVRVTVGDRGPGVDEPLLARIFDPYFSTHDAGTGLGLPIAMRIAEEHGGGITARNRSGGGLEVTIQLPVG